MAEDLTRCATCHRALKGVTGKFCSECNRSFGKPGEGTPAFPGRSAARRRRRRGR
jgi:hypothetical protein